MQPGRRAIALVLIALALGWSASAIAAADPWMDIEGRIQYGFYTEDARSLSEVVEQLSGPNSKDEPLHHYYVGLANFRLSSVLTARDRTRAREAAARCVARLDMAAQQKPGFGEALALQSACLRALSQLASFKPLAASKSTGYMEKAIKLAPKDPRVLLLDALDQGEAGPISRNSIVKLQKAAAAFEAERQGVDRTPGWGAAETYAYLGRGYLEQGDIVAARDALERALLIAPDFVLARKLMTQITG